MEPGNQTEIDRIIAAVRDGSLSRSDLDRNVRNMLNYIVKTPAFRGYAYSNAPDLKEHARIAREAAGESVVLLRNEQGTLPLQGTEQVALYGIGSIDFVAGGTGSGNVNKAYVVNMVDGLKNAGFGLDPSLGEYYRAYMAYDMAQKRLSSPNVRSGKYAEIPVPQAAITAQAARNDVAVLVIGRNAGEGADRRLVDDFELTQTERALLTDISNAYHQAGKKLIVVLNIGGVIETSSWKHLADAILLPWSPGQEGANAVADIIAGRINPSGRLPMTFPERYFDHPSSLNFPYDYNRNAVSQNRRAPLKDVDVTRYEEGIWVGYRFFETAGRSVSYPFGFGLSYTDFTFSRPVAKAAGDGFTASVTVTNTGKVAGKEVVQLYVSAPAGGLVKPVRELKAFAKTRLLQPGESQTLTFRVSAYELASFNEALNRWETAAGSYTVQFGRNADDIPASASFKQAKAQSWPVSDAFRGVEITELKL